MVDRASSLPTFTKIITTVPKLLRPLGKIRAGWELLLWAIIYGNSRNQFEDKLDYLVGGISRVPYWFAPHKFLVQYGGIVGWMLLVIAVTVAGFEVKEKISQKQLWLFRLIPLLVYAWLAYTNFRVFIDLIQQIQ